MEISNFIIYLKDRIICIFVYKKHVLVHFGSIEHVTRRETAAINATRETLCSKRHNTYIF